MVSGFFSRAGQQDSAFVAHWQGDQWEALEGLESEPIAIEYGHEHLLVSTLAGSNLDN